MPIKIRTLALLGLGALALPAAAESYNPSWYGLAGVNTMSAENDWHAADNQFGATLRLGKPLSQYFDVQLGASRARATDDGRSYRQTLGGADLLLIGSRGKGRPFLLIGAGAENDKISAGSLDKSKTAPYINAGAGVQAFFTDRFFAQADARYVFGFIKDSEWGHSHSNNVLFNLGLGYAFGDAPKAAVVAPVVTPKPAPAPKVAPAPEPKFEKVTLSASELFAFDKADLKPEQPKLDEIAAALTKNGESENVVVTGYTDRLGSDKYNNKLSKKRADAVKAYLVSKGVAANRIETIGKGKADPVIACGGLKKRAVLIECLAPNRRVEVAPITFTRQVK